MLYAPALVLAVWAVVRFAGAHSDVLAGVFLALVAVAVVISERQRQRLVRKRRDGYKRREED